MFDTCRDYYFRALGSYVFMLFELFWGKLKKISRTFFVFPPCCFNLLQFPFWLLILCKLIFFSVVFSKIKQSVSTQIVLNFVTYSFLLTENLIYFRNMGLLVDQDSRDMNSCHLHISSNSLQRG